MNHISEQQICDPVTIVIFGASGDLTHRKLIPALYAAYQQKLLPEHFSIIGFARRDYNSELFRSMMSESVNKFSRLNVDEEILKEANLEGSETVLALTNDDENNMMACVLAEKSGLKKRKIAIVTTSNYNLVHDSLNIDDLVDPRMTTVSRIMEHVHKGTIGTVYSLLDGEYEFIEAKILEKSDLLNKKIRDSNLPEDIRIGAIVRKDKVIIPRSNFIFEKDDLVVFLAKREQLKAVENIFSVGSF